MRAFRACAQGRRSANGLARVGTPRRQSEAFKVDARKARRYAMLENWKLSMLIAAVVLLVFVIFILPTFTSDDGDHRR